MRRLFGGRKKVAPQRFMGTPFCVLNEEHGADYRGVPTLVCPCGSDLLLIACVFDGEENLPGMFMTTGVCAFCGSLLTVADPTLLEVNA